MRSGKGQGRVWVLRSPDGTLLFDSSARTKNLVIDYCTESLRREGKINPMGFLCDDEWDNYDEDEPPPREPYCCRTCNGMSREEWTQEGEELRMQYEEEEKAKKALRLSPKEELQKLFNSGWSIVRASLVEEETKRHRKVTKYSVCA